MAEGLERPEVLEAPGLVRAADDLTEMADCIRWYCQRLPSWEEGSPCAEDHAHQNEFSELPFVKPMTTLALQPTMVLEQVQDHLTAAAAIIRTPYTVLALLTVMRPLFVGAGWIRYLTDPSIDLRERVRRGLNAQLESATEAMNFIRDDGEHLDRFAERRKEIVSAARKLGYGSITRPDRKKGYAGPFPAWWIGAKPPKEMELVASLMGGTGPAERSAGHALYRLMSAVTHAQQHALYPMLHPGDTRPGGDGYVMARIRPDPRMLLTWVFGITVVLDQTMTRCCGYYGWPALRWNSQAATKVNKYRKLAASQ